jgi:hypothetical protein
MTIQTINQNIQVYKNQLLTHSLYKKVKTIEDLHLCPKELIKDVVVGRGLQKEILAAKEKIDTRAKVKKLVIEFEYFARNKNIRIKSDQRAMLIAVSLFKEIISDLQEVIDLLLETKRNDIPVREQELRKKLAKTSMYAINRKAA